MTNYKFFFTLIFILIGCLIGVVLYYFLYPNDQSLTITLTIQLVPEQKDLPAVVQIHNKTIDYRGTITNGKFSFAVPEGKYILVVSAPNYLNWSKEINVKAEQNIKNITLDQIYLLPQKWPQESVVTNNNIVFFQVNPDFNSLVYIIKQSLSKNKTNYYWHLFNRQNKKDLEFWQTTTLPEEITLSAKSKKILAGFAKNDWRLLFFTGEDIQSYSLKELLASKIKAVSPAESSRQVVITKAIFNPLNEDEIIIQTKEAIYFYNFIKDSLEKAYNGEQSSFYLTEKNLYFLDSACNLMQLSLESSHQLNQVSFFTFNIQDLTKTKLVVNHTTGNTVFLIKDDKDQILLFTPNELTPKIIAKEAQDVSLSSDRQEILIKNQDNKILIYNLQAEKISEITSSIFPIKLFSDHWLILQDNSSYLRFNNFQDQNLIADNVKNQQLFFDDTLKQLFYLTSEGIAKISF